MVDKNKIERDKDNRNEIETTKINKATNEVVKMDRKISLDMGKEFGQTVTETMIYDQYLTQAIKILDNFNPVERVFKLREHMPDDETKKMVDNFGKSDMPTYLNAYKQMANEAFESGVDVLKLHREFTRLRKESLQQ